MPAPRCIVSAAKNAVGAGPVPATPENGEPAPVVSGASVPHSPFSSGFLIDEPPGNLFARGNAMARARAETGESRVP